MQIRHDRVVFIDCRDFSVMQKTQFLTSANFTEKIYICNPIISSCQLSPLRIVLSDISKVRFVHFNETELKMCRTIIM